MIAYKTRPQDCVQFRTAPAVGPAHGSYVAGGSGPATVQPRPTSSQEAPGPRICRADTSAFPLVLGSSQARAARGWGHRCVVKDEASRERSTPGRSLQAARAASSTKCRKSKRRSDQHAPTRQRMPWMAGGSASMETGTSRSPARNPASFRAGEREAGWRGRITDEERANHMHVAFMAAVTRQPVVNRRPLYAQRAHARAGARGDAARLSHHLPQHGAARRHPEDGDDERNGGELRATGGRDAGRVSGCARHDLLDRRTDRCRAGSEDEVIRQSTQHAPDDGCKPE